MKTLDLVAGPGNSPSSDLYFHEHLFICGEEVERILKLPYLSRGTRVQIKVNTKKFVGSRSISFIRTAGRCNFGIFNWKCPIHDAWLKKNGRYEDEENGYLYSNLRKEVGKLFPKATIGQKCTVYFQVLN